MKSAIKDKPAIKEIYHDSDGWWVILRDGWTIDDCVGWREDTKRALMRRLKDAKRTGIE